MLFLKRFLILDTEGARLQETKDHRLTKGNKNQFSDPVKTSLSFR